MTDKPITREELERLKRLATPSLGMDPVDVAAREDNFFEELRELAPGLIAAAERLHELEAECARCVERLEVRGRYSLGEHNTYSHVLGLIRKERE